ncbi:hypothetical protein Gorai_006502, partial [Gossypium raimondii]|nr:hypothetical protein [Gossypium raimondii]
MADSHFCGLYGSGVETLLHAVRDCLVARNVWLGEYGNDETARFSMENLNIGVCSTLDAELWEIMDGLGIAWKRGVKQLLVKSDCLVAVNMLNGQIDETEGSLARIVRK